MKRIFEFIYTFLKVKEIRHKTINLFAFFLNLFYIYFNIISGIIYENILSVTVAAYYAFIVIARYLVIADVRSVVTDKKLKSANIAASVLPIMAFSINGIIFYIVTVGEAKEYPLWILTVLGVYSVFATIRSGIGIFKASRSKSIVAHTAYSAWLSVSLLSLFNFQNSLLAVILPNSRFAVYLNFALGGSVSFFVLYFAYTSLKMKKRI